MHHLLALLSFSWVSLADLVEQKRAEKRKEESINRRGLPSPMNLSENLVIALCTLTCQLLIFSFHDFSFS